MKNYYMTYALPAFVVIIIIAALFSNTDAKGNRQGVLTQIPTQMLPQMVPQNDLTGQVPNQAPPISANDKPPELIRQMGIEIIPVSGGKVKITGVMGGSWADKALLRRNDIILRFDGKKLKSMDHFKMLVALAPSDRNYTMKFLRSGRVKSCLVAVGEGEMEGFTAIIPPR